MPPRNPDAVAQFERLKALEGTWAWSPELGPDLSGVVVTYEVTAAGSALLETMFPGDAFEMVTLYHLDGDQLVMTHYGSAGNQPTMRADLGPPEGPLHFEYIGATNLASVNTGHMHRMSFLQIEADELLTSWTYYEDQKAAGDRVFKLTRLTEVAEAEKEPEPTEEPPMTSDLLPLAPEADLDAAIEALEAELEEELAIEEEITEELPIEDLPTEEQPIEEPVAEEISTEEPAEGP